MNSVQSKQPKTCSELADIIRKTCLLEGWNTDLNFIDTSKVKNMSYLFSGYSKFGYGLGEFNGNISEWNTSNVRNMKGMFRESFFNSDISRWNTENVD